MSFQELSDGTLPDYFHNLWRKKFMTKEEIEKEKKQLDKLFMNNYMTEKSELSERITFTEKKNEY
jgi:hypothetical protein